MSKLNNTPIKPYLFIHRTGKLYTVVIAAALWTILTSLLTFTAINSKFFHNTYQCESTTLQPIKTQEHPVDTKQSKLINKISALYNIPKHEVYNILGVIRTYTENHKFPDTKTTLAIIATESAFKQHATSSANAKGYMQVLKASGKQVSTEPWQNIQSGTELLREYYQQLGSREAAIQAYNVGITAYKNGVRAPEYLNKVNRNLKQLESI